MRRSTARLHFFQNRIGCQVPCGGVTAEVRTAVAIDEFFELAVEQFSTELVAEGIPHYRIHTHQLSPSPQRQRIALATHIRRRAVSRVELGQTASGHNDGLGLKGNQLAVEQIKPHGSQGAAILSDNLNDSDVADTANV